MKVLVTNDDGILSEGLSVLANWARNRGHQVVVVAPKTNCSGQSGAITLRQSLTVTQMAPAYWAVGGTPADCVRIALAFLGVRPDLVLSGINHGWNLGHDIHASGTVGAARMAAMRGIPAIALSGPADRWPHVARLLEHHGDAILRTSAASGTDAVISVNFPLEKGTQLATAELSGPRFDDQLQWAEFDGEQHVVHLDFQDRTLPGADIETDAGAISRGFTTLTHLPLAPDWHLPSFLAQSSSR
ncbi:MAG: 5'/3'-nucleotidase SurE [Firmicutes bacterium]|nr:5'/3'-nucleotidase SurE [Bacillota bacterium]